MTLETHRKFEDMPRTLGFAIHQTVVTITEALSDRGIELRNMVDWNNLENYFADYSEGIKVIESMFVAVGQKLGPNPNVFREKISEISENCLPEISTANDKVRQFLAVMLVSYALKKGLEITDTEKLKVLSLDVRHFMGIDHLGFMANENFAFTHRFNMHHLVEKVLKVAKSNSKTIPA